MLLKAALNGARSPGSHPKLPLTADDLALDAAACVAAGAGAIHIHPRDRDGQESLNADVIDVTVRTVRAAVPVPIGVSTGAWIEPDPDRRIAAIAAWREPDMASVNLSEEGAERVMRALTLAGIGIEAGVWSVDDVDRLARTSIDFPITRMLIEIVDLVDEPVDAVRAIIAALDDLKIAARRLVHGQDKAAWPVLYYARDHGYGIRIGFEDTLKMPDGSAAYSNDALVRFALT